MRKSVLVVTLAVLALVVGFVLVYMERSARAATVDLDRALVALLPPNATSVIGVDVERLKGTPLYRHMEEQSRQADGKGRNPLDELVALTGFDPRRDVEELLVASWMEGGEPQFVAVARGRFPIAALGREIIGKKGRVETYRGVQVFGPEARPDTGERLRRVETQAGPKRRDEPGEFAFLDDRTALAGSRFGVRSAIDRKAGGGPSLLGNTAILSRAQSIRSSNQLWAVSQQPGEIVAKALPKDAPANASNFARIFSSMQYSVFALDLMNGLDLKVSGLCRTAEDAKTLGDAARGIIALGRLTLSQKEPEMMTVFDGVQVSEKGEELEIVVHIERQAFENLLEKSRSKTPVRTVSAGVPQR